MENLRRNRRDNPESAAQHIEAMNAKPFEILTNQIPESVVLQFMQDAALMKDIVTAKLPTDEETCERIAIKHGLGAEQVAAISKYQRAIDAEKRLGAESIH